MVENNQANSKALAIEPAGELIEAATLPTPLGELCFRRRVPYDFLQDMTLAEGLGIFFRFNTERQKNTLLKITRMDYGNVVIAHTEAKQVAGYVTMHPVEADERWSVLNMPDEPVRIYEFGAIEVSRLWRGLGLAKRLMHAAFDNDPWLEDKIIVSMELAWHWDYEQLGVNRFAYREILRRVIEEGGFVKMDTDEPNVMMDAANMFMVRVGSRVDNNLLQQFYAMLHKNNVWGL